MSLSPEILRLTTDLIKLGFEQSEGQSDVLTMTAGRQSYRLEVSLGNSLALSRIDFGALIKVGRPVSLAQRESLVVLECVIELLRTGYAPASIELERSYALGHNMGGWLDVLVKRDDNAFWMIECKTWGAEYTKFNKRLKSDGGQLFTYWLQSRDAKWLSLYSSRITEEGPERLMCTLSTASLDGDSVERVFASWNGELSTADFVSRTPYVLGSQPLRVGDLKDLREEDSGRIFHSFEEVLRRNAVSDKPNAFNKIFNLFICKVQDEEKTRPDEEVEFQWGEAEDSETVINRLSSLYAAGLDNFLQVDLPIHTIEGLSDILHSLSESDRDAVLRTFSELKTLSNSDFSFIDVFDQSTLRKNAQVVKEVVKLLENVRIRYTHKQPFMGEFFERLLNTSVKQEQGQYFTPIPLARFVLDSLPLQSITDAKIQNGDQHFLPYVIDYAAGAGHFLTEGMDVLSGILNDIDPQTLTRTQGSNLTSWSNLKWASEFVYGVEKDYRLAKTAKVACFLNGDGDANIITADGLARFDSPDSGYIKRLATKTTNQDNPVFDVIVANPPYSVEDCKSKVIDGERSFTLWPRLTDSSDDIECLFAERAKQLLAPGGVAGIIFPSSIAQSSGRVFSETRKMLLRYFDIKSLVTLGTGAFSDANVRTTVFFMERIEDVRWKNVQAGVARFFTSWTDATIDGVASPISKYSEAVWGLTLEQFTHVLKHSDGEQARAVVDVYKRFMAGGRKPVEYDTPEFWNYLVSTEREKIAYFIRTIQQSVVIANSPSPIPAQKRFLGYSFKSSNGTKAMTASRDAQSDSVISASGPKSLSAAISSHFDESLNELDQSLESIAAMVALTQLIDFGQGRFDAELTTIPPRAVPPSRYPRVMLGDLVDDENGVWEGNSDDRESTPIIRSTEFFGRDGLAVETAQSVMADRATLPQYLLSPGDILIERSGGGENQHVGRSRLFHGSSSPVAFGNFLIRLRMKKSSSISADFLFNLLQHEYDSGGFASMQKATNGFQNLDVDRFLRLEVPQVPEEQQASSMASITSLRELIDTRMDESKKVARELDSALRALLVAPIHECATFAGVPVTPAGMPQMVNLIELKDIESETGRRLSTALTPRSRIESNKRSFKVGDVLYGKLRPNLNKVLVADADGFCSTEIVVLRPSGDPVLLAAGMRQRRFVEAAMDSTRGMKMPRVPAQRLNLFEVPISSDPDVIAGVHALEAKILAYSEEIELVWAKINETRAKSIS